MSLAAEEPGALATPRPLSPPGDPNLHRLQAEIQLLSREIALIQEEIQTVEGLDPANICCKELVRINEYVVVNPDPMIPLKRKRDKTCCIWRWIRAIICFNMMWICCASGCGLRSKRPSCACKVLMVGASNTTVDAAAVAPATSSPGYAVVSQASPALNIYLDMYVLAQNVQNHAYAPDRHAV